MGRKLLTILFYYNLTSFFHKQTVPVHTVKICLLIRNEFFPYQPNKRTGSIIIKNTYI